MTFVRFTDLRWAQGFEEYRLLFMSFREELNIWDGGNAGWRMWL